MLNRVHPPRPDWYEEFYAEAMDKTMKSYEAEVSSLVDFCVVDQNWYVKSLRLCRWHLYFDKIAGYKCQLFANLTRKAEKILEIGIGTGPNLKYYGNVASVASVVGVDPNRKMEKYALAAAEASGLPPTNFKFIHAVCVLLAWSSFTWFIPFFSFGSVSIWPY